jgi:hypothetical protein
MNKKLGYYVCDGQEFNSKINCAIHATKVNKPMSWVFNNEVFDRYDFSQEPEESLDALYDRRAREIREKYDYVVLSYSGGSDSHNILMSFYRQGLHIDEVISNWVFEASKKFTIINSVVDDAWNQNAEYELHTKDRLQWIYDHMPNTKVTLYDCSKQIYSYFSKAKEPEWVTNHVEPLNPAATQRYNPLQIKDIRLRIDKEDSIGFVVGVDKPLSLIVDKKMYLRLRDKTANIIPSSIYTSEYDNTTVEYFYWAPESCAMLAKQGHIMLKHLNTNKQYQLIWTPSQVENFRAAQETLMRSIVYTTWDETNAFQTKKPTHDWYSELDYWFIEQFKNTPAGRNWQAGVDYVENSVDKSLQLTTGKKGLMTFFSPLYYIGDIV